MEIRDLNRNGNSLSIFADDQGDVYVTISRDAEIQSIGSVELSGTVRIGGCGSGHEVPPKIRSLLLQVAEEFEKYKDCKYENEAFNRDVKERFG